MTRAKFMFAMTMLLGWCVMTTFVAALFYQLPRRSVLAALEWGALYAATLVLPLVFTLRVHRRTQRLQEIHGSIPGPIRDELEYASWSYVAFGLFAAVAAVSLIVFYAAR